MTDSRVAPGLDRLPWLPDEPARPTKRPGLVVAWAIAATILVAAAAYWLGVHSETPQQFEVPSQPQTVTLPESHWQLGNSQWTRRDVGYARQISPGFRAILGNPDPQAFTSELYSEVNGTRAKITDNVIAVAVPG